MLGIPISTAYLRGFFRRWLSRGRPAAGPEEPRLTGAPARLRLKTYSSEAGAVYQYLYRGQEAREDSTTFVFSVTTNRKDWERVSVELDRQTVKEWEDTNTRTLRGIDLYAISKMSLFEALDRSQGSLPHAAIQPKGPDISRVLDALGLL